MKKDVLLKPLEASKWLRYPVFMSKEKLGELLDRLECFSFNISKVLSLEELQCGREYFERAYSEYIDCLDFKKNRASLSVALTKEKEYISLKEVAEGRYIARSVYPVVQIAPFSFAISSEGKILPHAMGISSIPFGLEFSYPAVYRDPVTLKIENGLKFPSALLWRECKEFFREGFDLLRLNIKGETITTSFRTEKGYEAILRSIPPLKNWIE